MTYQEWQQFMVDLSKAGHGDAVDKFEEAEKEVDAEMAERSAQAKRIIETANLAQHVDTAIKECRYIYYADVKGGKIVH